MSVATPRTWAGPLREARDVLRFALEQLAACPEQLRPFVILEEDVDVDNKRLRHKFVQFIGSAEEGLRFDVPELGIVADRSRPAIAVDEAADLAVTTMREQLGVAGDARVRIIFDTTQDPPRGFGDMRPRPGSA